MTLALLLFALTGCIEGEQVITGKVADHPAPSGQGGLTVEVLLAEPARYNHRQVTVSGRAVSGLAFEFVGEQPYRIEHKGQRLWVITRGTAPRDGDFVTVSGTVAAPYQLKGRHYDLVILESRRIE